MLLDNYKNTNSSVLEFCFMCLFCSNETSIPAYWNFQIEAKLNGAITKFQRTGIQAKAAEHTSNPMRIVNSSVLESCAGYKKRAAPF